MADPPIREAPDAMAAAIDASARRLGRSRSEHLHRVLASEVAAVSGTVTVEDLSQFAAVFGDLADPDVMRRAWW